MGSIWLVPHHALATSDRDMSHVSQAVTMITQSVLGPALCGSFSTMIASSTSIMPFISNWRCGAKGEPGVRRQGSDEAAQEARQNEGQTVKQNLLAAGGYSHVSLSELKHSGDGVVRQRIPKRSRRTEVTVTQRFEAFRETSQSSRNRRAGEMSELEVNRRRRGAQAAGFRGALGD